MQFDQLTQQSERRFPVFAEPVRPDNDPDQLRLDYGEVEENQLCFAFPEHITLQ